jgi:hypothetical protein
MSTEITALGEREILALAISLEAEDIGSTATLLRKSGAAFQGLLSALESRRFETAFLYLCGFPGRKIRKIAKICAE